MPRQPSQNYLWLGCHPWFMNLVRNLWLQAETATQHPFWVQQSPPGTHDSPHLHPHSCLHLTGTTMGHPAFVQHSWPAPLHSPGGHIQVWLVQQALAAVHASVQPLFAQQSVPGWQPPGHLQLAPQVHFSMKVQHDCFFDSIYTRG